MNDTLPAFRLPPCFDSMPPEDAARLLDLLAPDVAAYAAEAVFLATERTLVANFGPAMGRAVFADLMGTADKPNTELVAGTVSRAAVSKAAVRLRKGFGLPPRCPANARAGAKGKNADTATAEEPYGGIPWVDTTAAGRPAPNRKPRAPRAPAKPNDKTDLTAP